MRIAATQIRSSEVEICVLSHIAAPGCTEEIVSEMVYRVYSDGRIHIENTVNASEALPYLPRVGVEMIMPAGFETLTWYGRGPHENYSDRKRSALVGQYTSTVDEQFTNYVYTSESGGKGDVRWLSLTNEKGKGLLVTGLGLFHIDALHYTIADLEKSHHMHELTRRPETILHLDAAHMGVGGDDGWMAPVHTEFLVQPGRYQFGMVLQPLGV